MRCGKNDCAPEARLLHNLRQELTENCAGQPDLSKNTARKAVLFDEDLVPAAGFGAYKCRRRGICIFIGNYTRQPIVQIIRYHQEIPGGRKLLRVLLRKGCKLITGVELLILDAAPCILLRKRDSPATGGLFLQFFPDAVCPAVAVCDRVADQLLILIEKDEIDSPCIDADGSRLESGTFRRGYSRYHICDEPFDIPAKMPVLLDKSILEAIRLLKFHHAVLGPSDDVTAA